MTIMLQPKFSIGQKVYSVLPDTSVGVVIDIRFSFLTNVMEYQVSFVHTEQALWYINVELSEIPVYA